MMKKIYISLAVLLLSIAIYSCKKNAVQIIATPVSGAQIKYFNFALNGPSVNFYANNTKVSGAVTTTPGVELATGVGYGSVYPSTNAYSVIAPGTYDLKSRKPSTATPDPDLVIASINTSLADGKNYSLYTSGLYNTTTKSTEVFVVEDVLPPIDTSGAYVRLVHASYNANPFDLIMKNTTTLVETTVATNVAYKSASPFTKIKSGVYDLILRYTGTATNIVVRTGVSVVKSNTYTFSLRGDITIPYTSTTVTNRPFIDNTPNR